MARPAAGRAPGPVPPVQRGLHRDVGAGPAAPRPDRRGDPPRPGVAAPGARRRRGRRPAGAHAADRRSAAAPAPTPTATSCRWPSRTARWDADAIAEGVALVTGAWPQAASARTRCRPPSPRSTTRRPGRGHRLAPDPGALRPAGRVAPSPMVELNRAVADRHGARGHLVPLTPAPLTPSTWPPTPWRCKATSTPPGAAYRHATQLTTNVPERRQLALSWATTADPRASLRQRRPPGAARADGSGTRCRRGCPRRAKLDLGRVDAASPRAPGIALAPRSR